MDAYASNAIGKAKQIIHDAGGMMRPSEALLAGIHPQTLYMLRDSGVLVQISRGLYRHFLSMRSQPKSLMKFLLQYQAIANHPLLHTLPHAFINFLHLLIRQV